MNAPTNESYYIDHSTMGSEGGSKTGDMDSRVNLSVFYNTLTLENIAMYIY